MLSLSTRLPVAGALTATTAFVLTARLATLALRIFALDFDAIFYIPALFPTSRAQYSNPADPRYQRFPAPPIGLALPFSEARCRYRLWRVLPTIGIAILFGIFFEIL